MVDDWLSAGGWGGVGRWGGAWPSSPRLTQRPTCCCQSCRRREISNTYVCRRQTYKDKGAVALQICCSCKTGRGGGGGGGGVGGRGGITLRRHLLTSLCGESHGVAGESLIDLRCLVLRGSERLNMETSAAQRGNNSQEGISCGMRRGLLFGLLLNKRALHYSPAPP